MSAAVDCKLIYALCTTFLSLFVVICAFYLVQETCTVYKNLHKTAWQIDKFFVQVSIMCVISERMGNRSQQEAIELS